MPEGLTSDLVTITVVMAVLSLIISTRNVTLSWSLVIVLIKFSIPFIYFCWFRDGTSIQWDQYDGRHYYNEGLLLNQAGYTPWSIFTDLDFFPNVILFSGLHFAYAIVNFIAQFTFGHHYYAAVFFNVFFTFVSAHYAAKLFALLDYSKKFRTAFFVFFVLHWDVVSWSSFANLKGTFAVMLSVILMYCLIGVKKQYSIKYILGIALAALVLLFMRFYIPLLISVAYLVWLAFHSEGSFTKRIFILLGGVVLVLAMFPYHRLGDNIYVYLRNYSDLFMISRSMVKMIILPRPFEYGDYPFSIFAVLMNWVFLLPMILGGLLLTIRDKYFRFFLIYYFLLLFFYAGVDGLQNNRQRYNLVFVTSWMQFYYIWYSLNNVLKIRSKTVS